jgi:5-formyltetrahydrofolate cyclo-ligase
VSVDVAAAKAALRGELRARLRALDPEARAAAAAWTAGLVDALPGPLVAAWVPMPIELDVGPLLAAILARDGQIALPRVVGDALRFHRVRSLDALVAGPMGLREPAADAEIVATTALSSMLVPGLGFDRRGGRLGWGRGYYDRVLAGLGPEIQRFAAALACQEVEAVPREGHDQAVRVVWAP